MLRSSIVVVSVLLPFVLPSARRDPAAPSRIDSSSKKDDAAVRLAGLPAEEPPLVRTEQATSDDRPVVEGPEMLGPVNEDPAVADEPDIIDDSVVVDESIITYEPIVVGEPVDEQPVCRGGAAETPPFVDALDPPDAPPPPRPLLRVSRETKLPDPACSWKLAKPGTYIGSQPLPGGAENVDPLPASFTPTDATARTIVFDGPAYFPIVRHRDRFKSLEDEGLRILEGMTLRIMNDGSYEVEFLADGVAIPAILRLQFQISMGVESERRSITLPPLNLDPRKFPRNESPGTVWTVVHRGSAPWLLKAFEPRSGSDGRCLIPMLYVSRDGVARLGSGAALTNALPR